MQFLCLHTGYSDSEPLTVSMITPGKATVTVKLTKEQSRYVKDLAFTYAKETYTGNEQRALLPAPKSNDNASAVDADFDEEDRIPF